MKRRLNTIVLVLVLMFSFTLNVHAETKIKEDASTYTGDIYIIGSSRFDSSVVVTGTMATVAGARESYIQYVVNQNYEFQPEDVRIYYYSELEETWSVLPETSEDKRKILTEEETKELTENLNIYYVNEEEKILEMPYNVALEEGYELEFVANKEAYNDLIKYEDGKLKIPASVSWVEVYAVKESEIEGEEPEELYMGDVVQENTEFGIYDYMVRTYEELKLAIDEGVRDIQIVEDIDMPTALTITQPVTITFDDGVKLSISEDTAGDGVFHVLEGGNLTINGNGIIDGVGNNKWNLVIFAEAGKVTLNGGTYTNVNAKIMEEDTDSDHFDVIYAKGTAEVIINDGYFEGKTPAWILNIHDGSRETARITVRGGVFEGFNPAYNDTEGKGTDYVEEGFKVIPYNGEYQVNPMTAKDLVTVNKVAYTNLADAITYAEAGSTIKLEGNLELNSGVVVNKELTLDLNGYTLSASDTQSSTSLITVEPNGKLTVTGNGKIDSASQGNDYSMAIWARNGGIVTIENGTFTNVGGKAFEDNGTTPNNNELIYASGGGIVTINGGTYIGNVQNTTHGTKYTLNLKDNSNSEIIVKGGTFAALNPADSKSEPATKNFLADGYKVVEEDGDYTVVEVADEDILLVNGVAYSSLVDAFYNAEEKATIKLLKDIELYVGIKTTKELTLDLNGHTIEASDTQSSTSLFTVEDTGKLTITGNGKIDSASQGNDYSMAVWARNGGTVVIENGTFTNLGGKAFEDNGTTPNNNELIYASGGGIVTINGGTYIGNTDNTTHGTKYTLNLKDNSNSEIIVKGGTYIALNPADSKSEPSTKNFVAEGYKVVEDNGNYTVVAE